MSRKADPSRPLQAASFRDYHARAALRKEGFVIYYKRHLGDYAKKTGHLTTWEHGAYCLILDTYYDREVAPTTDEACRWARAKEPDAKRTVSDLLAEYFTLVDGRWIQQRVEDEIASALALCATNRMNGKLGGRPPRARKTARLANGNRNESENKGNPTNPTNPTKPLEDQKIPNLRLGVILPDDVPPELPIEPVAPKANPCPVQAIVALYHQHLPMLPRVGKLTQTRIKFIQARWREDLQTLDDWIAYFADVRTSPFLLGKTNGSNGHPPFRADLEWLCRPSNFAKTLEGKYHRAVQP